MRKVLILSLCFLTFVGCGCKNNKEKENKKEAPFDVNFDLSKEVTIDGLRISNIQVVVEKNGMSKYTATVTNETKDTYKLNQINMYIKDKDGNVVTTLIGYIGSNILSDESRTLNVSTDLNLMSGYEIEYEIKK